MISLISFRFLSLTRRMRPSLESSLSSKPLITFVSGNPDKRRDATTALSSKLSTIKLINLDLKEIQGSEEEIATDKCFLAMRMFENEIVVVEDTCKFVNFVFEIETLCYNYYI